MTSNSGTYEARRRKAHMLAKEIGLTDEDRIDLASMLLRRTVKSWKELDEAHYIRLLDAMEGHQLISHLEATRPTYSPKNSTRVS